MSLAEQYFENRTKLVVPTQMWCADAVWREQPYADGQTVGESGATIYPQMVASSVAGVSDRAASRCHTAEHICAPHRGTAGGPPVPHLPGT